MSKKLISIYAGGLIQGICLVAFPAASTIFTSASDFNFSSSQYGSLFISQCLLSIAASYLSPKCNRKFGTKGTFLLGLSANFASMILLLSSAFLMRETAAVYPLLIIATACLGIGFGLTVPTLNTMAALLRPERVDSVILALNALLGVGTTLAPLLISLFIDLGFWWGLPLSMVIFLILLMLFTAPLALPGGSISVVSEPAAAFPPKMWIFMGFAMLYGIIETLNGNWASIYMKEVQGVAIQSQTLALTLFWGMVTFGRVFFALLERYINERIVFQALPFVTAFSFILISMLNRGNEGLSLFAFGLAGFGCSALLPLVISFGSKQLTSISRAVAGDVIAFYLLGYGIAAFGTGSVLDLTKFNLSDVYALGAAIAAGLGVFAFVINQPIKEKS